MKLTFVIPAYNEEAYLSKCLTSIQLARSKSKADIEVIVVNNASTDKTREIASSFADVKVVDEPMKGLVRARRAGFLAATGDIIANIDADTIVPLKWIGTVLKAFEADPKLVAFSGPFIYYDLPHLVNFFIRGYYYVGYCTYLFNRYVLRIAGMLQGGNFVVRRTAMEQIGGYNLALEFYGEETDVARRLHKVGNVTFTFDLPMYTSGRRLAGEGIITMGIKYPLNYFWTLFFKRPFHTTHTDIRATPTEKQSVARPNWRLRLRWGVAVSMLVLASVGAALVYASDDSALSSGGFPTLLELKQSGENLSAKITETYNRLDSDDGAHHHAHKLRVQ